jgi:hypothetical protein
MGHVVRFLKAGNKVKVTIMFRGREQSRPELGFRLLKRLSEEVADLGFVEAAPKQDGRNMIMVLAPHRSTKAAAVTARTGSPRETAESAPEPVPVEPAPAATSAPPATPPPATPRPGPVSRPATAEPRPGPAGRPAAARPRPAAVSAAARVDRGTSDQ